METKNGASLHHLHHIHILVFGFILLFQNIMLVSCSEDQNTYSYHSPPPTDPHTRSPPIPTPSGHTPSPHRGSPPSNCGTPPTPHHNPTTPAPPTTTGYHYSPPSTPTDPINGTPSVPTPPTPPFDPNSPPFTCDYWRNHPALVWGVFGFWGTNLGSAFGTSTLPLIGSHPLTVQDALANTRTDGLGSLYRQATASLLNSMVYTNFHFTPAQVRDRFVSALVSDKAAASQARVFKLANEGRLKPRSL